VVGYVTNSGFKNWDPKQLPDLTDKTFVITGANGGLGYLCAQELGKRGANIVMACRSVAKAETARQRLEKIVDGSLAIVEVDLADMSSVRTGAVEVRKLVPGIDGLINNAGVMQTPKTRTVDGFELQLAANHLGHFLWTALLLDLVEASAGRVVAVSSVAHKYGKIEFDDLMLENSYSPSKAYCQSKLANLMFALELDHRLQEAGSKATAIAAHPGLSATNLQYSGPKGIWPALYKMIMPLMSQSAERGAIPILLAAAGKEAKRGAYYGPTGAGDMKGPIGDAKVTELAQDPEAQGRLWRESEKLVGRTFEFNSSP
jgi:NAD(P)-dependent dehydrogenase (short-subunit alcohol dehydrogenase family)